jgi:hypothetical protein
VRICYAKDVQRELRSIVGCALFCNSIEDSHGAHLESAKGTRVPTGLETLRLGQFQNRRSGAFWKLVVGTGAGAFGGNVNGEVVVGSHAEMLRGSDSFWQRCEATPCPVVSRRVTSCDVV